MAEKLTFWFPVITNPGFPWKLKIMIQAFPKTYFILKTIHTL